MLPQTWATKDGRILNISSMEQPHLVNVLSFLSKKYPDLAPDLPFHRLERAENVYLLQQFLADIEARLMELEKYSWITDCGDL